MTRAIYDKIDEAYKKHLQTRAIQDDWLLLQTLLTGISRRKFIEALPIRQDQESSILDAGTGFGALALDFAAGKPVQVEAIDTDTAKLDLAGKIYDELREADHFPGKIRFKQQNIEQLAYAEDTFDWVVSRFVFQYLPNPLLALKEIQRVLKPDGQVCIVDMDDSLFIHHPGNESYDLLLKAKRDLQALHGGDRYIGRKLAGLIQQAGLKVTNVKVDTDARFIEDPAAMLLHQYFFAKVFMAFREDILARALMTEQDFDYHFHQAFHHIQQVKFLNDAVIVVQAVKLA